MKQTEHGIGKLSIGWTRKGILNRIPNKRGCTARLLNKDMVQDTGANWLLTRNRKPHYFSELGELVDFILRNAPKTMPPRREKSTLWGGQE